MVHVVCKLADYRIDCSAQEGGTPAEFAASVKYTKYSKLAHSYIVQPVAIETAGMLNHSQTSTVGSVIQHINASRRHDNVVRDYRDL